MCISAPVYRVGSAHTSCLYVCVYICRERESVCVCLRLDVGYAVLMRLVCLCVYIYVERECVCVCACALISGTQCSYVLPVCVYIYTCSVCVCLYTYIYIYIDRWKGVLLLVRKDCANVKFTTCFDKTHPFTENTLSFPVQIENLTLAKSSCVRVKVLRYSDQIGQEQNPLSPQTGRTGGASQTPAGLVWGADAAGTARASVTGCCCRVYQRCAGAGRRRGARRGPRVVRAHEIQR